MARSFFLSCWLGLSFFLFSGNEKKKPDVEEKIEVIGKVPIVRALHSVTVFNEKELAFLQSAGLKAALNQSPGMLVLSAGHPGQFAYTFARGAAVNQVLFLVDGSKLSDPSSALSGNFSFLSPQVIQKVEIIRGPLSNLYGSNAMGGVVNLVTKKSNGFGFSLARGSHGTYEGDFFWGGKTASFDFSLNGHYLNYSDGVANDDLQKKGFSFKAGYAKKDLSIGISLFGNLVDSGIPINLGLPTPQRHYWQDNLLLAVPFQYRFSGSSELDLKLALHWNRYEFSDPDDTWNPSFANRSSIVEFTARFNALLWDKVKLSAGFDGSHQAIDNRGNGESLLENAITGSYSQFLSLNVDLGKLLLSGSARLDKYKNLRTVLSPQLGFSYNLLSNVKLRGAFARSFRAPTLPELLNPYWGNPGLTAETGESFELGGDLFLRSLILGVSLFDSRYRNLIGYSPVTWKFVNINEAVSQGVEVSLKQVIFSQWQLGLSYTYLKTRDLQYDRELLRRPRHTLSGQLSFQGRRFDFFAEMIYVGKRLDYDETLWAVSENPPFNTFNFVLSLHVSEKFSWFINISNAFNRRFEEVLGYPAPLRRISIGIKYQGVK